MQYYNQQQGDPAHQQSQEYYYQPSTYYSIDVECVATATDHNSRSIAQISLVDEHMNVLLDLFVQQEQPVVSYLTPLNGITKELLEQRGVPLAAAVATLKQTLPKHAILVGQNIGKDVEWLGLKEGVDFASLMDLAGLYRVWNTQYKSWSVFGQDHVAKVLLNWQSPEGSNEHSAVQDAQKAIALFNHHLYLQQNPEALKQAQEALLTSPVAPSFARRNPSFEGVCMGNRKSCTCGGTFFS